MTVTTNSIVTGVDDISSTSLSLITSRLPYSAYTLGNTGVGVSCTTSGVDENLFTISIPAGTIGENDIIEITPYWVYTNSANNKILFVKTAGGIDMFRRTRTTTAEEAPLIVYKNLNVLNNQSSIYARASSGSATYFSGGTTTPANTAIDFSVSQTLIIGGQRANVADTLTLQYARVIVYPGR